MLFEQPNNIGRLSWTKTMSFLTYKGNVIWKTKIYKEM